MNRLILPVLLAAFATSAFAQPRTAVAPSTPIPAATFAKLDAIENPQISTDGKVLAAKLRINGAHYLAVMALDDPAAKPQLIAKDGEFDKRGDLRAVAWEWIDADNLLVWIQARENLDGFKYDARRVIGYNRRSGKTTPLGWDGAFADAADVLWTSRSGPPRILLSRFAAGRGSERLFKPQVVEVEVETGKQRIAIQPHAFVTDWNADGDGVIRLGSSFDRDSGKLRVIHRPNADTHFDTIVNERVQRYSEPPYPQIFLPGGKTALVLSRESGFNALYEMDLETLALGRKIFGKDGYDVVGIEADRAGTALEEVRFVTDGLHREWFNPRMKEIQVVLDEAFGRGLANVVSSDNPRENLIIKVGAPDQAGAYYLYRTVTGDLGLIGWINPDLKDMKLNPVRTIRYRSSDGQSISAVLTMPRLKGTKNLPLIVLPHGGPWARDYEQWDMWAQPLAEMGYAVIQPNFRGSSGFGKAWEAASDGNWGMRMQDDLNDAVTHLATEGIADPKRVCMFGWSYGGYAASRAAQRDGDKYRCAISGAGVHDLAEMVNYDRNYLGRYGSKYIGAAASKLADVSPARFAADYSAPILIVHGAKDDRVPVAQSRSLVARLKRAGKVEGRDFVYLEQPRNTHHLPLESDRIQLIEEVKKFLDKHNPA